MLSRKRHSVTLKLEPPSDLARQWYELLGEHTPEVEGHSGPSHRDVARLVPYQHRDFHESYAHANGYYWLPCSLCARPYGGHEGGGSIPDPTGSDNSYITICSQCTIARNRGLTQP